MKKTFFILLSLLLGLLLVVCDRDEITTTDEEQYIKTIYEYQPPVNLNDGLDVSDLNSEGLDDASIRIMIDSINVGTYGLFHGLLIFRNNNLVFEEYFDGWKQQDLHPMWSVTKSISSAVIGLAIEQGKISGVNESVFNLFSGFTQVNWTTEHKQITLEHYLTMSAGYLWNDSDNSVPSSDPNNSYLQMINSDDWIKYVLELPLETFPGEKFKYNNGTSTLFSVIVSDAVENNFDNYTDTNLLSKIDIANHSWAYMAGGYPGTAGNDGGIFLTARDMSKFGLLYLNNGQWKGKQVINESWVQNSISPHIQILKNNNLHFDYGYQWWINERVKDKNMTEIAVPYATGRGGQYIFLINDYDMMVVIISPHYNPNSSTLKIFEMIEKYILSAIM